MDAVMTPSLALLTGVGVGALCGAAARGARICSFGAIEDAVAGGDYLRLRAFALALAVAMAGTQALIVAGLLQPADIALLPPRFPWAGAVFGGMAFGLGMALVGTCGFGALVRAGGGDLRAIVVLLVFAASAWAASSGSASAVRLRVLDPLAVELPMGGGTNLLMLAGIQGNALTIIRVALVASLLAWAMADSRLRRAWRYWLFGLAVGGGIIVGWTVTGILIDPFEATPKPQGLSFVAPVARVLQSLVLSSGPAMDFGIGTALGVPLGAAAAAVRMDEIRWEAFDDAREMRRHLVGAVLMGFGGIWAGGCTIGQGLSAGSLLAPSWPLATGGILVGAWCGIRILLEGGPVGALRQWTSRRGRF